MKRIKYASTSVTRIGTPLIFREQCYYHNRYSIASHINEPQPSRLCPLSLDFTSINPYIRPVKRNDHAKGAFYEQLHCCPTPFSIAKVV